MLPNDKGVGAVPQPFQFIVMSNGGANTRDVVAARLAR